MCRPEIRLKEVLGKRGGVHKALVKLLNYTVWPAAAKRGSENNWYVERGGG